jgi:hypothetical protein
MLRLGGYVFFSRGSALLSEVRAVETPAAERQPKHRVSHLPSVSVCQLLYILVGGQVNVEEEIEASRWLENAYVANSNASTSIGVGKGTAGPRGPYRYPVACVCQVLTVDPKASRSRRAWKEQLL